MTQATSDTTILANATLILPSSVIRGAVTIVDGQIIDVTAGAAVPAGALDCGGDYIAPGLIELHTDNLERHIEPRPKVNWPHGAAIIAHDAELAGAGITTVFDALRCGSIQSGKDAYLPQYARNLANELLALRGAGALRISHMIHLRAEICSETLIPELDQFTADDRIGIVSLMDHTPGQRQFADIDQLRTYVTKKRGMDEAAFQEHVAMRKALSAANGAVHEAGVVAAAARLNAVLASHDDTTAAHVTASAKYGIRVAEFPTTQVAAAACRDNGIAVMMGAPNLIRGGSHSGNVAAGDLARADLLDIISSDYVPAALLTSAFRLADIWGDLPRAFSTVTSAPATAARLHDRGQIAPGLRGDVIRVAMIADNPVIRGVWVQGARVA